MTVVKDELGNLFISATSNNEILYDYIKRVAEAEDMRDIEREVN